jgi:hypothetical protein
MNTKSLLDRIFGRAEEINGRERCPTYLFRWTILKFRGRGIYLHHFVGDDWSLDLHDHPKRFISIGLKGWYREETPSSQCEYHAPWLRTFAAEHIHRLTVPSKNCWTLVIVLKPVRSWGFWHAGKFIGWREYVDSDTADRMKACADSD